MRCAPRCWRAPRTRPTLTALYEELRGTAAKPDPQRRLLLGQIAEFLERYEEALDWYRGVPGGEQRWPARLRAANVMHELKRGTEAYQALRDLQSDAAAPTTKRDATRTCWKPTLRQQGQERRWRTGRLCARPGGVSRTIRTSSMRARWGGSDATTSPAPKPTSARSWSPIPTAPRH